jgi:hypothetical protein
MVDESFIKVFLLTFRSFCSPQELLDYLILKFFSKTEQECSDEIKNSFDQYQKETQKKYQRYNLGF